MKNLALIDLFLNEYWIEKGLSENTVQSYRLDLTALCDWLDKNGLSLETLDAVDLQGFSMNAWRKVIKPRAPREC